MTSPSEEDMRERLCLRYFAKAPLIEECDFPAHGPQMGSDSPDEDHHSPDEDHLDIWKVQRIFAISCIPIFNAFRLRSRFVI